MIYLDYNATTPLSKKARKAISNSLNIYGNPSSLYTIGLESKRLVDRSRQTVANLVNANPSQIVFTGCATESNNSVISSCVDSYSNRPLHIITTSVEHSAVLETVKYYQMYRNVDVTYLPTDSTGRISLDDLSNSLRDDTILVSIMMVNNEIGNIYDIKRLCSIVHSFNSNIKFHTDATQAVGKMVINVKDLDVDFLTISGHKFYAPKGIGALYIKDSTKFLPFMRGGHQECGLRAGTENLLSIIALGAAAEETKSFSDYNRIADLRDYIENRVLQFVQPSRVIGDIQSRVCNTSCLLFDNYNGIDICTLLDSFPENERVAISSGSACNSIELVPSHVMRALGIEHIPIRISLGRYTTREELDMFLRALMKTVNIIKKDKRRFVL